LAQENGKKEIKEATEGYPRLDERRCLEADLHERQNHSPSPTTQRRQIAEIAPSFCANSPRIRNSLFFVNLKPLASIFGTLRKKKIRFYPEM